MAANTVEFDNFGNAICIDTDPETLARALDLVDDDEEVVEEP